MRKSLLLYLFVFTVLVAVFQYVSARKMLSAKDETIVKLEERATIAEKRNDSLASENASLVTFSLASNNDALSYFEDRGYDAAQVAEIVEDEIIGRNRATEDNELVPYAGMEGKMRINQIKILNHKWIIANFTDGTYWGEVFITYEIDDNNNLILNTEKSLLYPRN